MNDRVRGIVSGLVALALVLVLVGLGSWCGASDELVTHSGHLPLVTFIGVAVVLTAFILVVGWGITGRPLGALIDGSKGRMSLSALQVSLWTIVVLAAYFNAFLVNLARNVDSPLSVTIPADLLIAMGISVSALAGSGIVQNVKVAQDSGIAPGASAAGLASPPIEAVRFAQVTSTLQGRAAGAAPQVDGTKKILRISDNSAASWRDLFEGEGPLTATSLDLGKVQMFFFTVVLVLGYAITVGNVYGGTIPADGVTALPQLDQAFVGLLAISQLGFLITKANAR